MYQLWFLLGGWSWPKNLQCIASIKSYINLGRAVRKPVNTNSRLKVKRSIDISYIKCVSPLIFWEFWDYSNSSLKEKWYKQKTSSKSYKNEFKILVNPLNNPPLGSIWSRFNPCSLYFFLVQTEDEQAITEVIKRDWKEWCTEQEK